MNINKDDVDTLKALIDTVSAMDLDYTDHVCGKEQ